MQEYNDLPLDALKTLHREIGALIAQRRHEALEQVKQQIAVLGFGIDDLVPRKQRSFGPGQIKYRDPDVPENTWAGRGKRPNWLQDKLDAGNSIDEFAVASDEQTSQHT